jgi:putative hydrolase of the HAD superfamily
VIRAVLFDLDDTLCDDLGAAEAKIRAVAARAREHLPGVSLDALTNAYNRVADEVWTAIDLINPPRLTDVRKELWRRALSDVGHEREDMALVDDLAALQLSLRHSTIHLFPDALETLDRLRAAGLRLALVTNGVSETHAEKIVALGIRDHFDAVLMPDEVGFAKPDARVFHLACERIGVAPNEAAHVGDNWMSDVAGAKGAGLFAVWFNPDGRPFPSRTLAPDAQVRALSEVPALVGVGEAAASR